MSVKRYNLDVDSDGGWEIGDAYPVAVEEPDGDYVKAEDYDALAAENAALRSRLDEVVARSEKYAGEIGALSAVGADLRLQLAEADALLLEWADATDAVFGAIGGRPGALSVKTRAYLSRKDRP